MPTAEVLREIKRATRPHGVARHEAFRLTPRQLEGCVESGALERPFRGVYLDPFSRPTPERDLAVAVAAGGRGAAAWGRSAAALWGLRDRHPARPEIVVPHRRYARVPNVNVHRSVALSATDVVVHLGIRSTTPMLAVVDLGVVIDALEVADAIIRARELRLFEPPAVRSLISRIARPGRDGIRIARDALDLVYIGDRPADSVLELRFVIGPATFGLPPFEYQFEVTIKGKRYRIDFAYPRVKLAIEVDGYKSRASAGALAYDDSRQNALVLDGWTVLRFTWWQVKNDPAGVALAILTKLADLRYPFAA